MLVSWGYCWAGFFFVVVVLLLYDARSHLAGIDP